jgi:hypothetical protein
MGVERNVGTITADVGTPIAAIYVVVVDVGAGTATKRAGS